MLLLGMTGPIGHGKTTFADALAALVPHTCRLESFYVVAEVADAMHTILRRDLDNPHLPLTPDPHDIAALNTWLSALPIVLPNIVHVSCGFDQIKLTQGDMARAPLSYKKLTLHAENLRHRPDLARHKITQTNKENYRPFLQWLGGYLVEKIDPGIWYHEVIRRVRVAQQGGCDLCIVGGVRYPSDAAILREAGGVIVKLYRPEYLQNDLQDPTERHREDIRVNTTVISNGTAADLRAFAPLFLEDLRHNRLQPSYQIIPQ